MRPAALSTSTSSDLLPEWTGYTLVVIIEDFTARGVLASPADLMNVCAAPGKKPPGQDLELQLTRANWLAILGVSGDASAA
jgi:hypothetical protein